MIHFQSQHDGEEVLLALRQHPIVMMPKLAFGFLLLVVPLFLPFFPFASVFPGIKIVPFLFVLTWLWLQCVALFFFEIFLSWYYNFYLLTNERVVDIDFVGLTHRSVSETAIRNVQDVTSKTHGFFQVLFGLGDVHIQTAGTTPEFEFPFLGNPEEVVRKISELLRKGGGRLG
ncbi:MAG: PH domain-containing protein [bacterium]|nr:PH domain-containing protein [bacterium]